MRRLAGFLLLLACPAFAQDPSLDEKSNAFLNRQATELLTEIDRTAQTCPPQWPEPRERYLSLLLFDGLLHDRYAAFRPPVQAFFQRRITRVAEELEKPFSGKGARIWHLYNMAFIVRTAGTTIAFDLVSGSSSGSASFALPPELMARLVRQCDALFISHWHKDHIDKAIARRFLAEGKPVVSPEQVWKGESLADSVTHLARDASRVHELPVSKGRKLRVVIFPGHQMKSTENNVTLVTTPEGLSFCQMGDQINEGNFTPDYAWIDEVWKQHKVDVLMPPCWTNEIERIVKGFRPKLVIPGHQNELGHPVDDRVPYWGDSSFLGLTYPQLKKSAYPLVTLTWGESVRYPLKR
jgi:L-ascorbate metabolism protein UlaG (beta-lactamase superfamily)